MCDAIVTAFLYMYPTDHVLYLTMNLEQQQVDEFAKNRNKECNNPTELEQRSL